MQYDPHEYNNHRTHSDANDLKARDTNNDNNDDFTYVYNKNGQLKEGVALGLSFTYDAVGRLISIDSIAKSKPLNVFRYNGLNSASSSIRAGPAGWHQS